MAPKSNTPHCRREIVNVKAKKVSALSHSYSGAALTMFLLAGYMHMF